MNLVKIIYEKIEISTALDVVADWESKAVIFLLLFVVATGVAKGCPMQKWQYEAIKKRIK